MCKKTSQVQFDSGAPITAYQQHDQNSPGFSSSDSALKVSDQILATNSIKDAYFPR